jgi:glycosyltransferase involved in cell wall biosynthesis
MPNFGGGGAERVGLRLARDWVGQGYEVDLLVLQNEGPLRELVAPGVNVIDLGADRIRRGFFPLVRYLRERRPHALHAILWPVTALAILARGCARVPTRIVTGDHTFLSNQHSHLPLTMALLKATTRFVYPHADVRVIVAGEAADDLAAMSGMRRDSIEVIYNPVEGPPPGTASTPAIEALWRGARGRVITVGTLKSPKNHLRLVRAFKTVAAAAPDARLMIVGEGPLEGEIRALAAELGIADRVILPGFTSDPWPYYASADMFVLSSDYEGLPLVLIEAMRAGLTIVSTDCKSGPREILDGGEYGRLVAQEDEAGLARAIVEGLAEPTDPERMRARAEALSRGNGSEPVRRYLELMLG